MTDLLHDDRDSLTRFILAGAGVRALRVHLDQAWREIAGRAEYPGAIATMLGETCVAAALFTGHAKVDGRLSIQLRGNGALRTLFAECTAAGTLRGIARLEEGAPPPEALDELGPDPILAITIENPSPRGHEPQRYQGLVPVEGEHLPEVFENYFLQSEQLPTRLLLAVADGRAAGLMLQKLPGDAGDADGWDRACALFETLAPGELLAWSTEDLVHRLFHEDQPEVLARRGLRFACSCSRERVAAMFQTLGHAEARAALSGDLAHVRCEFCGQGYSFDAGEIEALFLPDQAAGLAAPDRLQ